MARNLAKHTEGHIIVHNRTREKSEKLQKELGEHKIKIADTSAELVILSDVVFTNLANDEVVSSVYDNILHALKVCQFFLFENCRHRVLSCFIPDEGA